MRTSAGALLVVAALGVTATSLVLAQEQADELVRLSVPTRLASAAVGDWIEYQVTWEERFGRSRTKKSRTEVWVVEGAAQSVVLRRRARELMHLPRADDVSALTLIHYFCNNGGFSLRGISDTAALASRQFTGPRSMPERYRATAQLRRGVFTAEVKQDHTLADTSLTLRLSKDIPGLGVREAVCVRRSQIGEADARGVIPMSSVTLRFAHLRHGTAADPRPEAREDEAGD